jgi:hypothetical protein
MCQPLSVIFIYSYLHYIGPRHKIFILETRIRTSLTVQIPP